MKILKLTEEGRKNIENQIKDKKEELRQLGKYKGSAASNEGDAWHDNFAFEQVEIKERAVLHQINELEKQLRSAEIIETVEIDDNTVGINSEVTVLLTYSETEKEEITFTLVGDFGNTILSRISINSPIGECINGKSVGFEGKYTVNGNEISVKVLNVKN